MLLSSLLPDSPTTCTKTITVTCKITTTQNDSRSEISMEVSISTEVFWDVMPHTFTFGYQHFIWNWCLYLQERSSLFLLNTGTHLTNYMASHPIRLSSWLKMKSARSWVTTLEEFDVSVIAKLLPLKGPGWSVKEIKCNNTQTPQFINNQSQTSAWTYYIRGSYRKSWATFFCMRTGNSRRRRVWW